jgi:hypothetical protein
VQLQADIAPANVFHRSLAVHFDYISKTQIKWSTQMANKFSLLFCNTIGDDFATYTSGSGVIVAGQIPAPIDNSPGEIPLRIGSVTYAEDTLANITDLGKIIFLNGATNTVAYTIEPSDWFEHTIPIKCINNTNFAVYIIPATGLIDGQASLELSLNERIKVYSDGTNLYTVIE